jgi:uncharacterized surface protein with fasciclin (FAS1) repeats
MKPKLIRSGLLAVLAAGLLTAVPAKGTAQRPGPGRPTSEPCGEAEYTARRFRTFVVITAVGKHPTSGYEAFFRELPLDVYPPEFSFNHIKPSGVTNPVETPFKQTTSFEAFGDIDRVFVHDAKGRREVKVSQAGRAASADNFPASERTIVEELKDKNLTKFLELVESTDLVAVLNLRGPFTVLAPTDEAMNRLPMPYVQGLKGDKQKLIAFLGNHIMSGRRTVADIERNRSVNTWTGLVQVHPGQGLSAAINTIARYVTKDDYCGNGIIHVISAPLPPRP